MQALPIQPDTGLPAVVKDAMAYPDYPFQSRYHLVNNLRMHYLDEGDDAAEPLVMVHGNPSWSFFFRSPVLAFRQQYRCIVPDHIGMGLSDRPPEHAYAFDLASRINDLENLLDSIGVNSGITLVLHDWGGMIGMGYACRHPDRIKRLVIMNTAAFLLPGNARVPWQLRLARSPLGTFLVRGLNAFSRGAVRQCVVRRPLQAAVRQAYLAPYDSWNNRTAVHRFIQDIPLWPGDHSYDLVREIETGLDQFRSRPALICWGLQDFVFTQPFLQEWQRRLPAAQAHSFADAGHYLLEDAADEVIGFMRPFLAA